MKIPVLLRPVALGAHLVALVLTATAVSLGLWQLGTWSNHREDASAEAISGDPVPLIETMGADDPFMSEDVGRPVTVSGEWLSEHTVYVRERDHDGVEGYWTLTMLAVDGSESAVPVVRGWSESIDPRPAQPQGRAEVVGWLQPTEGRKGMVDDDGSDDVIPQVRIGDLVQHVDRDLYGAYVLVDHEAQSVNPATAGLAAIDLEQVPQVSATTGWRNFLYAVEWWIFASFVVFIWARWCRDEVLAARAPGAAGTDPTSGSDDAGNGPGLGDEPHQRADV